MRFTIKSLGNKSGGKSTPVRCYSTRKVLSWETTWYSQGTERSQKDSSQWTSTRSRVVLDEARVIGKEGKAVKLWSFPLLAGELGFLTFASSLLVWPSADRQEVKEAYSREVIFKLSTQNEQNVCNSLLLWKFSVSWNSPSIF